MSGVSKLGNNRYLATSKNVNRVLNQLNGILANGNITVQTVTTGATTAVTVDLAAGNFVNLTLNTTTSGATAITFTNYMPGTYFLKITTGNTNNTVTFSPNLQVASGTRYVPSTGSANIDLITLICDGTSLYIISLQKALTNMSQA
jgi:hypothetical protein